MQQRQPRLGDIVDDYCPRERRITNHAVVAMVGDEVKQTRCTTCDADHEYKQRESAAAAAEEGRGRRPVPAGAGRHAPQGDRADLVGRSRRDDGSDDTALIRSSDEPAA